MKSLHARLSICRNDIVPGPPTSVLCFPNLDAVFGLLRPESDTAHSSLQYSEDTWELREWSPYS